MVHSAAGAPGGTTPAEETASRRGQAQAGVEDRAAERRPGEEVSVVDLYQGGQMKRLGDILREQQGGREAEDVLTPDMLRAVPRMRRRSSSAERAQVTEYWEGHIGLSVPEPGFLISALRMATPESVCRCIDAAQRLEGDPWEHVKGMLRARR